MQCLARLDFADFGGGLACRQLACHARSQCVDLARDIVKQIMSSAELRRPMYRHGTRSLDFTGI
jgi:hypothetical protein